MYVGLGKVYSPELLECVSAMNMSDAAGITIVLICFNFTHFSFVVECNTQ